MIETLLSDPSVNASALVTPPKNRKEEDHHDYFDNDLTDDDVDEEDDDSRMEATTALHAAASRGHLEAVVLLVEVGGASLAAEDSAWLTAMVVAEKRGQGGRGGLPGRGGEIQLPRDRGRQSGRGGRCLEGRGLRLKQ